MDWNHQPDYTIVYGECTETVKGKERKVHVRLICLGGGWYILSQNGHMNEAALGKWTRTKILARPVKSAPVSA